MQLTAIKATTKTEQVNLLFSDERVLPFPVSKLTRFNLSKGMEVDSVLLKKITRASITFVLTNYALRLIAMSPQTQATINSKISIYLKRYLFKTGLDLDAEIQQQVKEDVVDYLKEKQLLDDLEYARFLVHKHQHKSVREIRYRLQRAGLPPNLGLGQNVDEEGNIRKLIQKKLKGDQDLSDFNTKNKIIAYLCRKGFPLESVKTVIDSLKKNG